MIYYVPREILLAKELGEHRIEFYCQLFGMRNKQGNINFSIDDIVRRAGYTANRSGRVIKEAAMFIEEMQKRKYLGGKFISAKEIKPSAFISLPFNWERFYPKSFLLVDDYELKHLCGRPKHLNCLCFIRSLERDFILKTHYNSIETTLSLSHGTVVDAIQKLADELIITFKSSRECLDINDVRGRRICDARQADIS